MKEHFAICTDGMHQTFIVKIEGDVTESLRLKGDNPQYHLSIYPSPESWQTRKLTCTAMIPFFIYGEETVHMIVDRDRNIIYSIWNGKYKEQWHNHYLKIFDRFPLDIPSINCLVYHPNDSAL